MTGSYAVMHLNEITNPIGITVSRMFFGELETKVYYVTKAGYYDAWKARPFLTIEQTKAGFLKFLLDVR